MRTLFLVALVACASNPPRPQCARVEPDAALARRMGNRTVWMRYSVGPDRYATNVEPVDPDAPPEAVDFAKRRLQSCPFPADAKPSGQWRYRFHAPREDGAVPELLREGIDRPEPRCGPAPPRAVPGHTGTVLANYVVETDGSVLDLDVMNPGADEALWDSVRSWLTSCRFKPAMRDGKPLPVIVIQPFIFR